MLLCILSMPPSFTATTFNCLIYKRLPPTSLDHAVCLLHPPSPPLLPTSGSGQSMPYFPCALPPLSKYGSFSPWSKPHANIDIKKKKKKSKYGATSPYHALFPTSLAALSFRNSSYISMTVPCYCTRYNGELLFLFISSSRLP